MTSEVIQILMSPDAPYFRISTFGNSGSAHVSITIIMIEIFSKRVSHTPSVGKTFYIK